MNGRAAGLEFKGKKIRIESLPPIWLGLSWEGQYFPNNLSFFFLISPFHLAPKQMCVHRKKFIPLQFASSGKFRNARIHSCSKHPNFPKEAVRPPRHYSKTALTGKAANEGADQLGERFLCYIWEYTETLMNVWDD